MFDTWSTIEIVATMIILIGLGFTSVVLWLVWEDYKIFMDRVRRGLVGRVEPKRRLALVRIRNEVVKIVLLFGFLSIAIISGFLPPRQDPNLIPLAQTPAFILMGMVIVLSISSITSLVERFWILDLTPKEGSNLWKWTYNHLLSGVSQLSSSFSSLFRRSKKH